MEVPISSRHSPTSKQPLLPKSGLASTLVLALGTFAVGTDAFVPAGFLPRTADSLGVSTTTAGQAVTVFAAAYAVLTPILAATTARVPRRPLLVCALLTLGVADMGSAIAPSFPLLLATRVLAATGAAAYTPNAGAVNSALVRPELRGRALTVVVGGLTIATALGVPLGDLAGRCRGWRSALALVGAACLAVAAAVVMPRLPGNPPMSLARGLTAVRRPAVLATLPLTVLGMAAAYTVYAYSIPALHAVGVDDAWSAVMLAVYGLGAIGGTMASGYATDRWSATRVLTCGYLAMVITLGALACMAGTHTTAFPVTVVLMVAWGASTWCQTPPQQHRLITAAPAEAPLVVALNASAIYLGIGAGTLIGGVTLPYGVSVMYGTGTALGALALAFLVVTTRRTSPPHALVPHRRQS